MTRERKAYDWLEQQVGENAAGIIFMICLGVGSLLFLIGINIVIRIGWIFVTAYILIVGPISLVSYLIYGAPKPKLQPPEYWAEQHKLMLEQQAARKLEIEASDAWQRRRPR